MEASALTHAQKRGIFSRRSPLLKFQGDENLVALTRKGHQHAFDAIVERYQSRLLGFCRQMLGSTEDAEDVLQEVFVAAYRAMVADERPIAVRPWLYRIARNRCLNYLRKPKADAQESMDMVPEVDAASTAECVHNREEFRQILSDVNKLPETQRAALLLREMDALSYEEIAAAMDTTVPSVKSLLVRARISLTEASQARLLTCGEVRIELSEAAEGLRKASAPVRRHVRECDECADFRSQLRSNEKALAALFPVAPLIAFKGFILSKLGLGGAGGAGAAGATGAGAGAIGGAGAGAIGGVGAAAAIGGGGAAGGIGAALGTKAVAGVVTAAVLTAGAVEVKEKTSATPVPSSSSAHVQEIDKSHAAPTQIVAAHPAPATEPEPIAAVEPVTAPPVPEPAPVATTEEEAEPAPAPAAEEETEEAAGSAAGEETLESEGITAAKPSAGVAGAHGGTGTVVVTVGGKPTPPASEPAPPAESAPPPPPQESAPPASSPPPSSPPVVEVEVPLPVTPAPAPKPAPTAGEPAAE
ncbi:MAG TPA: RNA polymerase sigma factor [Solirubrobacterales bacterium]|nr:RNA polymerase sigma factor [Solirubrobacterales bacterium]